MNTNTRTKQQLIDHKKYIRRKARREAGLREAGVIRTLAPRINPRTGEPMGSIKILAMKDKTKDTTAFDKAVKEASERIEARYSLANARQKP